MVLGLDREISREGEMGAKRVARAEKLEIYTVKQILSNLSCPF